MVRTISLATVVLVALIFLSVPLRSHAQTTPSTPGFKALTKDANFDKMFSMTGAKIPQTTDLGTFINTAFKMAISIGAILAVLRIAYAGYQYMSSDAWGEKSHAKEILADVTIGILLLLSIYLILNQINPQILKLQIQGLTPPTTTAPSATTGYF